MTYKITVEKLEPPTEGAQWGETKRIYEQTVEDMDVAKIIKAVNDVV